MVLKEDTSSFLAFQICSMEKSNVISDEALKKRRVEQEANDEMSLGGS